MKILTTKPRSQIKAISPKSGIDKTSQSSSPSDAIPAGTPMGLLLALTYAIAQPSLTGYGGAGPRVSIKKTN